MTDNALEYMFQEALGCLDCVFADKKQIGKGPCCTFIRGPKQEQGSNACLNRKAE